MEYCRDCFHWAKEQGNSGIIKPIDPDTLEYMEMPFMVGRCDHPGITLFERNPDPAGVSLCDGSQYMAEMYTGEKFGCVNWTKED